MSANYHAFEVFGLEVEYMIVNKTSLEVMSLTDKVLHDIAGSYVEEVEVDDIGWSNELALHVIELKTPKPVKKIEPLGDSFQKGIQKINKLLEPYNAILMPTAMHPWMNPEKEMKLWPHGNSPIYEAYNRIFDCKGHGWANLQSVHLNLPFGNDEEFGKIHAALRLILPLIPAIAASSPIADGHLQAFRDYRLEVYRYNQALIPSITGNVIPEAVFNKEDYKKHVLNKMYQDISQYDTEGLLQEEWLNSRGAIARFDRDAFEIRLTDTQECINADLALAAFIMEILKAIVSEKWIDYDHQKQFFDEQLNAVLLDTIRIGENALIIDPTYLAAFGIDGKSCKAIEVWRHIFNSLKDSLVSHSWITPVEFILNNGNLSSRIIGALEGDYSHKSLQRVYKKLTNCLAENKMFNV